jgi:hypothetical protein
MIGVALSCLDTALVNVALPGRQTYCSLRLFLRSTLAYTRPASTPMKTTITLGDMQDKGMRMLVVACSGCERRGRLSIARLIAEHGHDGYDLRWLIAHDCPKVQNPTADIYIYDRCGVHFPELPRWF